RLLQLAEIRDPTVHGLVDRFLVLSPRRGLGLNKKKDTNTHDQPARHGRLPPISPRVTRRCSIPAAIARVLQVFVPAPMGIRRHPARHYHLFADGWSAVTRRLVTDGLPLPSVC